MKAVLDQLEKTEHRLVIHFLRYDGWYSVSHVDSYLVGIHTELSMYEISGLRFKMSTHS